MIQVLDLKPVKIELNMSYIFQILRKAQFYWEWKQNKFCNK